MNQSVRDRAAACVDARPAGLATILVLTNKPLVSTVNGYDLRVWHLSRALRSDSRLVLLHFPFEPGEAALQRDKQDIDMRDLFDEVIATASPEDFKASFRRHLRLREDRFLEWGYPAFQQQVIDQINALCRRYRITKIIAFGSGLAGLLRHHSVDARILIDVCDSMALTLERGLQLQRRRMALAERIRATLTHARWRSLEAKLPDWFDAVVTINDMDTEKIRQLAHRSGKRHGKKHGKQQAMQHGMRHDNLSTIPNGVTADFEDAYQEGACRRRGVAFWGNLSFPPNDDALHFFYNEVFLPFLKPARIELCIVGAQPMPWLVQACQHEPLMRLTGFVDDLRACLIEYPIMINPMRMGSGMKNKVLEAHAVGLAVVSTALGMESIAGAEAGISYLDASNPAEFDQAIRCLLDDEGRRLRLLRAARRIVVERYTWAIVGARWNELVRRL